MTTPRARLLIVDDQVDAVEALAIWLQAQKFEVDTACSCAEALSMIELKRYDVVLLDLHLGDGHGMQVATALAEFPTAIIIMTGYPTVPSAQQAIRAEVFAYLVKPVQFPELLKYVNDAVASVQMQPTETSRLAFLGRRAGAWTERAGQRLRRIATLHDTEPVELLLALMTFTRGVWTLAYGGDWDAMWVASEVPVWVWGLLMVGIGGSRFVAVAVNNFKWRSIIAGVSFAVWLYLTVKFLITGTPVPAVPINLLLAGASLWVLLRLAQEERAPRA